MARIIVCTCCTLRLGTAAELAATDPSDVTELERLYHSASWPRPECPRCEDGRMVDEDEQDDGADAWITHNEIARSYR